MRFSDAYNNAAKDIEVNNLNRRLVELAKLMPSTEAGIEAVDLITNAHANVTSERFKRETIAYIEHKFKQYVK